MINKCKTLLRILKEVDKLMVIYHFKGYNNRDSTTREKDIPSYITKWRRYIDRLYPNEKCGFCNPKIKVSYDGKRSL